MIKILQSENGYYVSVQSRNGTVISESGYLKSKKSALKNIKAMAGVFGIESNVPVKVVDCTGERKEVVVL